MYYELYIDILFLINFMMDFLLLLIVKAMTKCSTTHVRLLIGSLIGAFLTCFIVIFLNDFKIIEFAAFHVIVNTAIIKVGFKVGNIRMFLRCLVSLYIGSFLLGGVFQYFIQYLKISSLFFAVAIISYFTVRSIWALHSHFHNQNERWVEVEIFVCENHIRVKALLDTGNGLLDPYSKKPVSILEKKDGQKLLDGIEDIQLHIRYIPYHVIGKDGVMKAFKASKIHIYGEVERCIESPVIAISEGQISKTNEYQMILNPDIF